MDISEKVLNIYIWYFQEFLNIVLLHSYIPLMFILLYSIINIFDIANLYVLYKNALRPKYYLYVIFIFPLKDK